MNLDTGKERGSSTDVLIEHSHMMSDWAHDEECSSRLSVSRALRLWCILIATSLVIAIVLRARVGTHKSKLVIAPLISRPSALQTFLRYNTLFAAQVGTQCPPVVVLCQYTDHLTGVDRELVC